MPWTYMYIHGMDLNVMDLYIYMSMLCVACRSRVELKDFPGGHAVFSLVADFCYNMPPKVSKDNVVQLRCAAELLQMSGPGNLANAADKFLQVGQRWAVGGREG